MSFLIGMNGPINGCIKDGSGNKYWYRDGLLHKDGGPAIEFVNGNCMWYCDGKQHREGGPAVEVAGTYNIWVRNGKYHREDGPAMEYANGCKFWFFNGKEIKCSSQKEFERLIKMKAFW